MRGMAWVSSGYGSHRSRGVESRSWSRADLHFCLCSRVEMANVRPRYNVKGRAASIAKAADSGHKRKATEYSPDDSNDPIIDQAARKKLKLEVSQLLTLLQLRSVF